MMKVRERLVLIGGTVVFVTAVLLFLASLAGGLFYGFGAPVPEWAVRWLLVGFAIGCSGLIMILVGLILDRVMSKQSS